MTDASIMVGYKQPDPNAPAPHTPAWLWLVTLVLLGVIVAIQQLGQEEPPSRADREAAAAGLTVEPPGVSMLVLFGKMLLFVEHYAPQQTAEFMRTIEEQAGVQERPVTEVVVPPPPDAPPETPTDTPPGSEAQPRVIPVPGPLDPEPAPADPADPRSPPAETLAQPPPSEPQDPIPPPAVNRFRVALLEAEAYGPTAAIDRMTALATDLDPESPLHDDIAAAITVYRDGPDALDPTAADEVVERHGWFGRLLLSYDRPETDPFRQSALASAMWGFTFITIIMAGLLLGLIAGVVLLIVGGVMGMSGQLRPALARPRAGGRLWLETFAVFIAGFLLVQVAVALVTATAPDDAAWPTWVRLGSQWSLALLIFWPLLRGMSFERFRGEVGWHRGRGFFREVGAGLLTYIAALPIYFGVAALLVAIMFLYREYTGADEPPPLPDNTVSELLERGGLGVQILLASLVVLWAPLVEETIFRGALYRAVRAPLGAAGAALLTAAFFAVMHAYAPIQLILVGTLGLIFAFMREWRGSLLPSITAHCIHNTIVLTVMVVVIRLSQG